MGVCEALSTRPSSHIHFTTTASFWDALCPWQFTCDVLHRYPFMGFVVVNQAVHSVG